jgi:anti-anti-sigma factor
MGHYANRNGSAAPGESPGVRLSHLRPGVPCVHARGRLDHATAPGFQQFVLEQLVATPWAIVLDLSALSALTHSAVRALVELACRAGEADIGLYLVVAAGPVGQAFAAAGVRRLFEIHDSSDSALRAMSGLA